MGKDGSGKQVELTPQLTHISVWCGAHLSVLAGRAVLDVQRTYRAKLASAVYTIARHVVLLWLRAPGLNKALRQLIAGAPAGVKSSSSILAMPCSSAPAVLEGWLPLEHQVIRQLTRQLMQLLQQRPQTPRQLVMWAPGRTLAPQAPRPPRLHR